MQQLRNRKAFLEAEEAAELGVDYSDYQQRVKDRKKERKAAKKRGRVQEYAAHDHL